MWQAVRSDLLRYGVIDLILLVKVGTGEEQGAAGTGWSQWPGPL
jgi:hypothetical protein